MQEGKTWATVKKGHDSRMLVEALLVRLPGLKRAAGNLQRLGRLTQGDPLGLQITILIEEGSASGAIPVWVTITIALWMGLDYGSHSDLLLHPLPCWCDG
jgi:hypothetical protein